jgi:hypothetical protein
MVPRELLAKLWKYFAGIGRNHGMPVLAAGGTSNHAHLLVVLPADVAFAKAVQILKANSSRWLGEHGLRFAWQEGYGAFSVSSSNRDAVIKALPALPCRAFRFRAFGTGVWERGAFWASDIGVREWPEFRGLGHRVGEMARILCLRHWVSPDGSRPIRRGPSSGDPDHRKIALIRSGKH